jgi:hypothetical protein
MVMALFRGMCCLNPQYSSISIREAKYTCLGYKTRLHTLDPPFSISFFEERPFNTPDPEQKNNQETLDKSQVPQVDPSTMGLHNSNQR